MKFNATGHKNIKATHKTTLEFTKEDFLTPKGDCIIGIDADIDFAKDIPVFRKSLDLRARKLRKIKINLKHGRHSDSVIAFFNPQFSHKEAMVVRKSAFIDKRTFAYKANKSSKELKRDIFESLRKKEEKGKLSVEIVPVRIRNIIFDFDDTLEEWTESQHAMEDDLSSEIWKRYRIPKKKFMKEFVKAEKKYILKTKNPKKYSRAIWIKDALDALSIKSTKNDIFELVDSYWKNCEYAIKLEKHVIPTLEALKKEFKLFILSDSDGGKELKMARIRKLGLEKYFKDIITSDDTKANKPSPEGFKYLLKKHDLKPEECISVGDHAETDLYTPKNLGMTTVWIKQGHWKDAKVDYNYIDFEINDIKSLLTIAKKFS
ncbi:MAG: HAD-IA family hydrolase [Candidatus Woesearchaeota archaeon]